MIGLSNDVLCFGAFRLDVGERRLSRDGVPIELSGRYFDALALLAGEAGMLITKDRFMAEVWRGVPVTDEALTQCIRSLRRALGDQAARPRFIETVPKHGYRFLVKVQAEPKVVEAPETSGPSVIAGAGAWRTILLAGAAGLAGGAGAGLIGGIAYGLLAATVPPPGTGGISILLVITCLCLLVGMLGGLGLGLGAALGQFLAPARLLPMMAGGAVGGLVVGSLGRLVGLDSFSLLVGSRPLAITGGSEGLVIGALGGAALWLAGRENGARHERRTVGLGALLGAAAGLFITSAGGKMMAGSLAGVAAAHPDAPLGQLTDGLSPITLLGAGALEGAIFVSALTMAHCLLERGKRIDAG